MAESLMTALVTKNGEKLPTRQGNPRQLRELFAVGVQVRNQDCVRQIGLAS